MRTPRRRVETGQQRRGARAEAWRGRLIGLAERALALHCKRAHARVAFGQPLAKQGVTVAKTDTEEKLKKSAAKVTVSCFRSLACNSIYRVVFF